MLLKRTLWGYDPRWIRVEAIDDANPVNTLFTWFEPADSLTGMTDSPLKPQTAK